MKANMGKVLFGVGIALCSAMLSTDEVTTRTALWSLTAGALMMCGGKLGWPK